MSKHLLITLDIRDSAEQRGDSSQESRYQELYKNAIASIKRLEDENVALKSKVEELSRQNVTTTNNIPSELAADRFSRSFSVSDAEDAILAEVPTCTAPDAAVSFSAADDTGMKAEVTKLRMRYKALADNFRTAKDALMRRKTERNQWKDHAISLERLIQAAESEHNIEIFKSTTEPSTSKASGVHGSAPIQAEISTSQPLSSPNAGQNAGIGQAMVSDKVDPANLPESTQGSSQPTSTEELPSLPPGQLTEVRIKSEPSSDEPSVVFTRPVKRKRDDDPSPASTPQIKRELLHDSSPITLSAVHPATQESIDLDDVGQHTMTPRKRQELENARLLHQTPSISAVTPVAAYVRPDNIPQTARPLHRSSALTPLSVNQERLVRSGGEKPKYNGGPVKRKVGGGIATVTEDGEDYGLSRSELQTSRTPANGASRGRLHALLNTPAIENSPSLTSPPKQRRKLDSDLSIPERRQLPFDSAGRPLLKRSVVQMAPPIDRQGSTSPQRSPVRGPRKSTSSMLRNKPLSELRVDDFKINPATNEGHDFAFSEVVRDKEDRACLPGCTDMHCCGKQFRALALSQRPNPPLTAAQRQDEQRLLEQYLGEYSYRLPTMTKEEKDEVWLEAKTQELANKYGKHRHRYSRMRSPPGFWNADFPSTQDLESDRAEAAKRERKMVAERHREAMRPAGRWLFRDE